MSAKKLALGKGLGALLNNEYSGEGKSISSMQTNVVGGISNISLNQINANIDQPRKEFDEEKLSQLAQSIKQQGIIQPITVRKIGRNKYELISGERRFRASKIIGLKEIPAYIKEANDTQALEMALVENIQRQDLNALEIALSYQHLITDCNISMEDIGEKVSKNRSTVNNYLRLLKLPDSIQAAVKSNKLGMSHARAIININNEQDQLIVFDEIIKKDLSVRQVEDLVRKLNDKSNTQGKTEVILPYKYKQLHTKLKKEFGGNINIKRNAKGKGSLVFNYKNDDELDELLSKLLNQ